MSTLVSLATGIETDYQGDIPDSIKVCRPDMSVAISDTNLPYIHETIGVPDSTAAGIVYGNFLVKAQTSLSNDFVILNVGCMMEKNNDNSYSLLVGGKTTLDNYKSFYRPFSTESDNMWTHVLNYFRDTRGLVFVKKISIVIDTPVIGQINGLHLIGDGGAVEITSNNENWTFKASYPWSTPGNIVSWRQ
jgi:hypothetical protein